MSHHERAASLIERLDAPTLAGMKGKSLLLTADWSAAEIETLVTLAEVFEAFDRAAIPTPLFPHELFYSLFFDNSTRTKSSWAGAAARLGAHPFVADAASTQVAHGETAEETGAMLGMNAHALGIRHDLILGEGNRFMRDAEKGISDYLQATSNPRVVPLVNLQCDIDHPTQSLADLCWLHEVFAGELKGKTIAVSWAYSPSYAKPLSVPQGLITLLTRFGMNVRLAHPEGYRLMPRCLEQAQRFAGESGGSFQVTGDMDEAFRGADIVYPKSWGPYDLMLERVEANRNRDSAAMKAIEARALERNRQFTAWICDERRMALTGGAGGGSGRASGVGGASGRASSGGQAPSGGPALSGGRPPSGGPALYMHCLPADIGAEVSPDVMNRHRVNVAREANKKVYVIMAALAAAKEPRLVERLGDFLASSDEPDAAPRPRR